MTEKLNYVVSKTSSYQNNNVKYTNVNCTKRSSVAVDRPKSRAKRNVDRTWILSIFYESKKSRYDVSEIKQRQKKGKEQREFSLKKQPFINSEGNWYGFFTDFFVILQIMVKIGCPIDSNQIIE